MTGWSDGRIELSVTSALQNLASPYSVRRTVLVKFGHLVEDAYRIKVNDQDLGELKREMTLEQGWKSRFKG